MGNKKTKKKLKIVSNYFYIDDEINEKKKQVAYKLIDFCIF